MAFCQSTQSVLTYSRHTQPSQNNLQFIYISIIHRIEISHSAIHFLLFINLDIPNNVSYIRNKLSNKVMPTYLYNHKKFQRSYTIFIFFIITIDLSWIHLDASLIQVFITKCIIFFIVQFKYWEKVVLKISL